VRPPDSGLALLSDLTESGAAMPPRFACSSTQVADHATVTIAGEVDVATAGDLRRSGDLVLRDPKVTTVAVDCQDVTLRRNHSSPGRTT
jgi:hypothetical protein